MTDFFAEKVLLPEGWTRNVTIKTDDNGIITDIEKETSIGDSTPLKGFTISGVPNLHSHAFQKAMAGLAEIAGPSDDSFWTWRKIMYSMVEKLSPDDAEAIAAMLYMEMLKNGYTSVAEFHYLHNDTDGGFYDTPEEMSLRVIKAALDTGIAITHLPVMYAYSGFGEAPANDGQKRFLNTTDSFLYMVKNLQNRFADSKDVDVGAAPHSLRAVSPVQLKEIISEIKESPVHIHIAEQTKEVEDCISWSGVRPVQWLFDNNEINGRWCLIHATHIDSRETAMLAKSGAVAGICPLTEGNLGDGFFPASEYDGFYGIGSDSHIAVNAAKEMEMLEYGQRLLLRKRNVLADGEGKSTGETIYNKCLEGGAKALGKPVGKIAKGYRADFVVLDRNSPALMDKNDKNLIDSWIFAANDNPVKDVVTGGKYVIKDKHHASEEKIISDYRVVLEKLK